MIPRARFVVRIFVFFLCVALPSGCGSDGPVLVPVKGKVLFEGNPAEGASVIFVPADEQNELRPTGVVSADGTFSLQTYPHGTGAPAGEYTVVISWYPPNARGLENPKNKLPHRYAEQSQSGLKAIVKETSTELEPFRLTK